MPGLIPDTPQFAFVGLGNLGQHMALNLAKHLATLQPAHPPLQVWTRTTSKAQAFAKENGSIVKAVENLDDIAANCDVIVTSLANDAAVQEVYKALMKAETARPKKNGTKTIFLDTSTMYPDITKRIHDDVVASDTRCFFQAPVFGPPPMAKSASLVYVIAGAKEPRAVVEPYLVPSTGRKIMDFGDDVTKASAFKLIGNSIVLSTVEMLAETMTLADKAGIGADRVQEWIELFYPAPSAIGYGNKILNNKFAADGGFTVAGGLKDARHIKRLGEENNCPMHITERAIQHLLVSQEASKGQDKDWSSLVAGQRKESGLPLWPEHQ
ncbi:NAD(P)-binding protein [Acaromyces ingoldii]|uniref:NAD(P)-binding protein n=1 Tax=Acaromyces ingoldii TaxID=215250 RepID=A0A316YM01_9BASI|nr:NAD(P)-binding protein [Acaromyces ingoldii]PWN90279.1 NAD(P)-binding protein [Acaromyces ingoldii]